MAAMTTYGVISGPPGADSTPSVRLIHSPSFWLPRPCPEDSRANSYPWSPFPPRRARPGPGPHNHPVLLQGYLAHKKPPTPLTPPEEPRHGPAVGSCGVAVSFGRGTPTPPRARIAAPSCYPYVHLTPTPSSEPNIEDWNSRSEDYNTYCEDFNTHRAHHWSPFPPRAPRVGVSSTGFGVRA